MDVLEFMRWKLYIRPRKCSAANSYLSLENLICIHDNDLHTAVFFPFDHVFVYVSVCVWIMNELFAFDVPWAAIICSTFCQLPLCVWFRMRFCTACVAVVTVCVCVCESDRYFILSPTVCVCLSAKSAIWPCHECCIIILVCHHYVIEYQYLYQYCAFIYDVILWHFNKDMHGKQAHTHSYSHMEKPKRERVTTVYGAILPHTRKPYYYSLFGWNSWDTEICISVCCLFAGSILRFVRLFCGISIESPPPPRYYIFSRFDFIPSSIPIYT